MKRSLRDEPRCTRQEKREVFTRPTAHPPLSGCHQSNAGATGKEATALRIEEDFGGSSGSCVLEFTFARHQVLGGATVPSFQGGCS
jgi:hypothetical protein